MSVQSRLGTGFFHSLDIVYRSRDVYPFEVRDVGRSRVCGERTRSLASIGILSVRQGPRIRGMIMNLNRLRAIIVCLGWGFLTCLVVVHPGGEDWVGRIVDFHVAPGHVRDVSFCVEGGFEPG
jgi:hypothetical protein